jgi:anti-sigma factor RsiW
MIRINNGSSMSNEAHVLDLLPAYALGSLDGEEAQLVADHLLLCRACQAELDAYGEVVGQLALPIRELSPPADLKQQLIGRVQAAQPTAKTQSRSTRRVWRPQFRPVWGLAALLLLLGLAVLSLSLWQQANQAAVGSHRMRAIALNDSPIAPEASGVVVIGADGRNGALVVDKFPQLAADQSYQLWLGRDGEYTSGALFTVDESGYRGTRILAPRSLLDYSTVRITIEPAEGSLQPSGEQLMDGSLNNP